MITERNTWIKNDNNTANTRKSVHKAMPIQLSPGFSHIFLVFVFTMMCYLGYPLTPMFCMSFHQMLRLGIYHEQHSKKTTRASNCTEKMRAEF